MAKTSIQVNNIQASLLSQLGSFVDVSLVDVPYTAITKRAQIPNLASDLMPRMGIERVMLKRVEEIQDEYDSGSPSRRVYRLADDWQDRFRFCGAWVNVSSDNGTYVQTNVSSDFMEITFYGTGLNVLCAVDTNNRGWNYQVDNGGSSTLNITGNAVLNNKNYAECRIFNVVKGLTQGLHTIRLTSFNTNNKIMQGVEILNETTTLRTGPGTGFRGTRRQILQAANTQDYTTGFASGTLGTRGGNVVVYLQDGQVKKAVQPTENASINLGTGTPDHSNEEVMRTYHWREFGAGTGDNAFSSLQPGSNSAAYTLDDNCTNLTASLAGEVNGGLNIANGGSIAFTFVGTGLDIVEVPGGAITTTYDVLIDGTTVASGIALGSNTNALIKIVSGLQFGTHIVRINRTSAGNSTNFGGFRVYGPKKPAVPSDAVELAQYYIPANFSANGAVGTDTKANGVIRHHATREVQYVGTTWTRGLNAGQLGGYDVSSSSTNKVLSFTFFGTGFDMRWQSGATRVTAAAAALNGTALNSSYPGASGITVSCIGTGIAFGGISGTALLSTAASANLDQADAAAQDGCGWRISGLPLGLYTLTLTDTSTNILIVSAFDVIAPMYVPSYTNPSLNGGALSVGSQCIADTRSVPARLSTKNTKTWAQAHGINASPTISSTAFVPVADMQCSMYCSGGPVAVSFAVAPFHDVQNGDVDFAIYIDGAQVGPTYQFEEPVVSPNQVEILQSATLICPVGPGVHTFHLMWKTQGATASLRGANRTLSVWEL